MGEPVAQEMERIREPVLIIAHQGILRILYAYFMGLDRKDAPYVNIPLNNVIQLTPHAYGCHEERFCLMEKREMMENDGQDEPVTSMPVKTTTTKTETAAVLPSLPVLDHKQQKKEEDDDGNEEDSDNEKYKFDPIMNAPSC